MSPLSLDVVTKQQRTTAGARFNPATGLGTPDFGRLAADFARLAADFRH
jgi:hypothetical protein